MNTDSLDRSLTYIRSWLQLRYDQSEIPGYVVAIAHKGEVVFNEAYGYADVEAKTRLMNDHIFRIASHSKTFTATALMQLQEKGQLRIDEYVVTYVPWLKEHKDERWQKVTLRQLMSHGAGVIRDGLNSDYWQLERPFPNAAELKREILEADLVLETNRKLKYSNFGYSLLGLVIETVSGKPYDEYVIEHIIEPLELQDTGPEYTDSVKPRLVTGYSGRELNNTRLPIDSIDTRAMAAATGFYATAEDLCRYFTAHMVGSGKLLSDESKKEMQRAQYQAHIPSDEHSTKAYSLGFEMERIGKHMTFGHGGGFPGHITRTLCNPENELVVVVLTNCIDGPAESIAKGVFELLDYFQDHAPKTSKKDELSIYEGRYWNLWGVTDILASEKKLVSFDPGSWSPCKVAEELAHVSDSTFKVCETNSYMAEGELVHFHMNGGVVELVTYNGGTLWPEKAWLEKQSRRSRITLP